MEKLEFCIVFVGLLNGASAIKNSTEGPQKIIIKNYSMIQQPHFWVNVQKNHKQCLEEN